MHEESLSKGSEAILINKLKILKQKIAGNFLIYRTPHGHIHLYAAEL